MSSQSLRTPLSILAAISLVAVAFSIAAMSQRANAQSSAQADESEAAAFRSPDLILVKFHADWCPKCRALQPLFDEVAEKHASADILFVQLDRTNATTSAQSELHAAQLGLGEHWDAFRKKNGYIALFNAETGELVEEYHSRIKHKDIADSIAGHVG